MTLTEDNQTSPSLILRAKALEPLAWERLAKLYTPLVYQWVNGAGLQHHDATDVVQNVFQAVAKSIVKFDMGAGQPAFRGWLYGITRFKVKDHFRSKYKNPVAKGGTEAQIRFVELPEVEPSSDAEESDLTNKQGLAYRALELMKTDFQEKTWQAFWRVAIEEQAPADVAELLGMAVGSVYTAKSRVLSHLRSELVGLL